MGAGRNALQTLVLVNGGASVAILAFLGNLATKGSPASLQALVPGTSAAMLAFATGAFFGEPAASRCVT